MAHTQGFKFAGSLKTAKNDGSFDVQTSGFSYINENIFKLTILPKKMFSWNPIVKRMAKSIISFKIHLEKTLCMRIKEVSLLLITKLTTGLFM